MHFIKQNIIKSVETVTFYMVTYEVSLLSHLCWDEDTVRSHTII